MKNDVTIGLDGFETSVKMELVLTSETKDFNLLAQEYVRCLEQCIKKCEEKGIKGKLNFKIIKEE